MGRGGGYVVWRYNCSNRCVYRMFLCVFLSLCILYVHVYARVCMYIFVHVHVIMYSGHESGSPDLSKCHKYHHANYQHSHPNQLLHTTAKPCQKLLVRIYHLISIQVYQIYAEFNKSFQVP